MALPLENENKCKLLDVRGWTRSEKALAQIGYNGYVTVELLPFVRKDSIEEPGRPEKTAQAMKSIFK